MFPFNQSYRPRQPSPDLPISPVSIKAIKKPRMKGRHSPYPRPFIPTPSSPSVPSEGELDGMRECDPYLIEEDKVVQFASPMDLMRQETPQTPLKEEYAVVEDNVTKHEEVQPKKEPVEEETLEEHISEEIEDTRPEPDTSFEYGDDGLSLQEIPLDHDEVNTTNLSPHEETSSQEKPQPKLNLTSHQSDPETELHTPEPLKYGDLVVVDYAEKRKVHKWPAIVVPEGHMTDNMLDYPPEDDDTAIGVRWIEPTPSYSWVPERTVMKLTPEMIDEVLATTKGPKKLIQAWEMARNPPSPFEYMLEKKMNYHTLVEKYKSL